MTKAIAELKFEDEIRYFEEHTWVKVDGALVKVGITDFAQDNLGDIIFIELPEEGATFDKGEEFGQAESAKTTSALYMPVSGKIVSVNGKLEDAPDLVNNDPYEGGWMIVIKPNDIKEVETLLTKDSYLNFIKED